MTPTMQKEPLEFKGGNKRSRGHLSNTQLHTHTGRTPAGRLQNMPSWAGGFVPPRLDEDGPAVTAVTPSVANEHNGIYAILNM
jgi:hypothetical protein